LLPLPLSAPLFPLPAPFSPLLFLPIFSLFLLIYIYIYIYMISFYRRFLLYVLSDIKVMDPDLVPSEQWCNTPVRVIILLLGLEERGQWTLQYEAMDSRTPYAPAPSTPL
jgi:hypothetical protein